MDVNREARFAALRRRSGAGRAIRYCVHDAALCQFGPGKARTVNDCRLLWSKKRGTMEERFLFNQIAGLYDQARAGYPPALFDDIVAGAGLSPGDWMLEVGCGTGKATESFAAKGLNIVALDPGGQMIAAAERRLAA
jgi:2-polyprenyl-3-methyl-5-hydroxy-6-metoxy-1,4-benzoquinol methylase